MSTNQYSRTPSMDGTITAHPFVQGLNSEHVQKLIAVAMMKQFQPGDVICREGEPANRFYLISHGQVELEFKGQSESAPLHYTIGDGDVVGWSWLFPPYYWHFSATAVTATDAIFFYGTRLRDQCDEDPAFGYALMKRVAAVAIKRLDDTCAQLLALQKSAS